MDAEQLKSRNDMAMIFLLVALLGCSAYEGQWFLLTAISILWIDAIILLFVE